MKTLVVYDLGNLFFCARKRYGEGRINYTKVSEHIGEAAKSMGYTPHNSKTFTDALKFLGIDVTIQVGNPTVRIACDILEIANQFDRIVICSSRREVSSLIRRIKDKGVRVDIFACGVPSDLITIADSFEELPEDYITKKDNNEAIAPTEDT